MYYSDLVMMNKRGASSAAGQRDCLAFLGMAKSPELGLEILASHSEGLLPR